MHRSHIDSAWIDRWILEPQEPLPEEVTHRFIKVVRVSEEEKVGLFDGGGRQVVGMFIRHSRSLKDAVLTTAKPSHPSITVLQAAIEESKLEETLKRGTEIGVDCFVIFNAHKSEPFLLAKLKKREERLRRVLTDAARQSGRLFLPTVIWAKDLKEALSLEKKGHLGIFGDLSSELLLSSLFTQKAKPSDIVIAVGPEGGLLDQEKVLLLEHSFQGVRWAPFTLRTELAGVMAVAIINAFLGRA